MNRSTPGRVFWRLMWKEYRSQRAFWIGVAVLALLLMLLAMVSVIQPWEGTQWQYSIALVLPAFFALGCGATLGDWASVLHDEWAAGDLVYGYAAVLYGSGRS